MLSWLRFLTPPSGADDYQTFSMRVLHYTLLLLMALVGLATLFSTSPTQWIFLALFMIVLGLCYALLHTGRFRLASALFLGGLWVVLSLAAFSINGIRNSGISSYAIIIIFSALLFTERATLFFTVISILAALALVLGELAGFLPLRRTDLFITDRFFQNTALFISSGVLLAFSSRLIRRMYGQAQERNRALETEIAERQRAEANLRASEETYRILFENKGAMSIVYDEDGYVVLANQAVSALLGKTPHELKGQHVRDLFPEPQATWALEQHHRAIQSGQPQIAEGEFYLPAAGRVVNFLRHVALLPAATATSKRQVIAITTDITERKLAEQRQRELLIANEKNAFLTDFLSTISHDLKTPLSVLHTSLYLLERAGGNQQYRQEKIAQMKEQVGLLDKYIQDMLTIARIEHLPMITQAPINLHALIESALNLLRPRAENKGVYCKCNLQAENSFIIGDHEQIARALLNLLENAINYTPPAGQVMVETRQEDAFVVVTISDTGIGISPDDLPHIFERFYRAEQARQTLANGTGLGLAIVQKVIAIHHGTISVTSAQGIGTTFSIRLPLKDASHHR